MRAAINRAHPLWVAFLIHRLSGLTLALFLPVHFWVMAQALINPARFDAFAAATSVNAAKVAEFGLVFLLAVHMFGGLRLMAMEFLPWSGPQKTLAAGAAALSFLIATLFFMQAI
ncbi:succinate dehydrogenase [Gymnodinialimonas ceratoperidinii]|uniref:Succinate dehydrogenase cytochrome b556 subunit n=1 Tax=Gymnodinialimonas ceratoperidinii TaxID=2856823 RepID=A0A8F6YDK4_9RHOB|nr:succinate dehydrogenase [Gymnodinialimonas ceratoperidinii]QXT40282.1 succinate dehydrogenase [Gymnodinialimonas ceratoperidinii]